MTVLAAMQSAAIRLIGRKPSVFFTAASSNFELEIVDLLNEVADDIADYHDWQALTKFHTITGDGTTTAFPKPDDYNRMAVGADVNNVDAWFWNFTHCLDLNEWLNITDGNYLAVSPGWWILLQDQFQFYPAPGASQTARFPYISGNYARDSLGTPKSAFAADTDTFVLPEKLLTLGLIWKWRESKRLDTTSDSENFMAELSTQASRDGGSRVIRSRRHLGGDFRVAWPFELG